MIYQLENQFLEVGISDFGLRLQRFKIKSPDRLPIDISLGFDSEEEYHSASEKYYGAIIGPFSNRVKDARISIGENSFQLDRNKGNHLLHSGKNGWHNRNWTLIESNEESLTFSLTDKETLKIVGATIDALARFTLQGKSLGLTLEIVSDSLIPVNPTYHPFFNLNQSAEQNISNHLFEISGEEIIEVNEELLPTGQIVDIKDSNLDFTKRKNPFCANGKKNHSQFELIGNIDHNYRLYPQRDFDAKIYSPSSGLELTIKSNQPCLQFYDSTFLDESIPAKNDQIYSRNSAFALEPQGYPLFFDSNTFRPYYLSPGDTYLLDISYTIDIL